MSSVRPVLRTYFEGTECRRQFRATTGPPFAYVLFLGGLSSLSAWWVALGIHVVTESAWLPSGQRRPRTHAVDVCLDLQSRPGASLLAQPRSLRRLGCRVQRCEPAGGVRDAHARGPLPPERPQAQRVRSTTRQATLSLLPKPRKGDILADGQPKAHHDQRVRPTATSVDRPVRRARGSAARSGRRVSGPVRSGAAVLGLPSDAPRDRESRSRASGRPHLQANPACGSADGSSRTRKHDTQGNVVKCRLSRAVV